MKNLEDKIVFITGASSGIGKAFAFAEQGAKLIISARRANIIEKVADEIRANYKVEVFAQKLDVKNKK